MKKTLFALLACATLAAPAMAKEWEVSYAYAGVYNNDRTQENYTFYTFHLDTADITTTIQNNTLAEFKTTYGEGFSCTSDLDDQLGFDVESCVNIPTDNPYNIWGVVVYQNGDDALFSAFAPTEVYTDISLVGFDYYDGQTVYVAFKPESPATPEPATATLSLLALAALASRRKRR